MPAAPRWTTWPDVVQALRRRWDDGRLPAEALGSDPVVPLELPLRRPTARQLAEDLDAVRSWAAGWESLPRGVQVELAPVGGRLIGVNQLPARVVVDTEQALWSALRVAGEVALLRARRAAAPEPIAAWMTAHPRRVLAAGDAWDRAVATVDHIASGVRPDSYLRELDVPGVDTKFIETHRGLLADLLDVVLPPDRIDQTAPRGDLARRYGFAGRPDLVRIRLPPGAPGPFSDLSVRVAELASAPLPGHRVLVCENEITFLALPALPDTVLVLGGGYAVRRLAPLSWLGDRQVSYWGDLDTHGFAILDALRAHVPGVGSVLMDQDTLLAHREHWGSEPTPTRARLTRLTEPEQALYRELVSDAHGPAVRLEQERLRPSWYIPRLPG